MTAWVKAGTREEVGVITDYTDERQDFVDPAVLALLTTIL